MYSEGRSYRARGCGAATERLVIPQGPPHTEEEKRATYLALARLKAQRKTREECALALGVSVVRANV